jgi:Protein of unknown function (DUF3307)
VRQKKNPLVLLLHVGLVTLATGLLLGQWNHPLVWLVAGTHLVIDLVKTWLLPDNLGSFLLDKLLHLAVLVAGAWYWDGAAAGGWWFTHCLDPDQELLMLRAATVVAGIVLCVQAGGIVVAKTVRPLLSQEQFDQMRGVPHGGRLIGWLERALVMLLVWIGEPAGIGFLVTAKSILRFGDIKDSANRQVTEYVIIGTFLSFGWAILTTTLLQRALLLWNAAVP